MEFRSRYRSAGWIALFLFLCFVPALMALSAPAAGERLILSDDIHTIKVLDGLEALEDPGRTNTLQDLLNAGEDAAFYSLNGRPLGVGLTDSVYWVRFGVRYSGMNPKVWRLEVTYPILNEIDVYLLDDRGRVVRIEQGGDHRAPLKRLHSYPYPLFELPLEPGRDYQVYMRLRSDSFLQAPMLMHSDAGLMRQLAERRLLLGIFYGIMSAMLLYNLFLFSVLRDVSYLYYVNYVFFVIAFKVFMDGLGTRYIWGESQWWMDRSVTFFGMLAVVGALMFTRHFLRTWKHVPGVDRIGRYLIITALLTVPVMEAWDGGLISSNYATLLNALMLFTVLLAGVTSLHRRVPQAKHFMIAWAPLLAGVTVYMLTNQRLLPFTFWTDEALRFGIMIETVLLSLALAARIHFMRRQQIHLQQELTLRLESEVRKRTQELLQANEKLRDISERDTLTGVTNRRYFERLHSDLSHRVAGQVRLALLMVDIDHFKCINDTYGHDCGDVCLQSVARTIEGCLDRSGDVVSRFGGEEFVVSLMNATEPGAAVVAERIRQAIENLQIEYDGMMIPITVSIGVAVVVLSEEFDRQALLRAADGALYEAKAAGRNQVVIAGTAFSGAHA